MDAHDSHHQPDAEAVLCIALFASEKRTRRHKGGKCLDHLDHKPDAEARKIAAAGGGENVPADGAEQTLL